MGTSWLVLFVGIVFEVGASICLKLSQGFTRPLPSVLIFVLMGLSLACDAVAVKKLDVSVAYAVWASVGTAMVTLIGIFLFKEPAHWLKFASLALIVLGVVGLAFSSGQH
ncbi:DMT family transporter [Levilinea saccharolytica]|uniref:Membrane protein n=1 Tax=Levilinea saccharolytica TaxID=229921 RepID=A0A0P6X072_9CHLR|nr:multidrug efflux SMR transporter [Levilinea saccharolytica]KPL75592.1 membrane protein [Levilinea saccharolytica]GAP17065.1 membrane transporter of cations and cationic drugs [Levilinea saccharolytica]